MWRVVRGRVGTCELERVCDPSTASLSFSLVDQCIKMGMQHLLHVWQLTMVMFDRGASTLQRKSELH